MSFQAFTWVLEHSTARGTPRLVLYSIAHHADENGRNSWPGIDLLVHETNSSETAVHRALKHLEAEGLIVIEVQMGGPPEMRKDKRPNRYTVCGVPPSAPRGNRRPGRQPGQGPEQRFRGGVPQTAPGADRGVPTTPERGAVGVDDGVPIRSQRGAAGGTQTDHELSEGTDHRTDPPPSSTVTQPAATSNSGSEEDLNDQRLLDCWPILCDLRLAKRQGDPIRDEQAWRRKVTRKDRRELLSRARELLGWYPTLSARDLAIALRDGPNSWVLDQHTRSICDRCFDSGMVDTGAGFAPCPVCRPTHAVDLRLEDAP